MTTQGQNGYEYDGRQHFVTGCLPDGEPTWWPICGIDHYTKIYDSTKMLAAVTCVQCLKWTKLALDRTTATRITQPTEPEEPLIARRHWSTGHFHNSYPACEIGYITRTIYDSTRTLTAVTCAQCLDRAQMSLDVAVRNLRSQARTERSRLLYALTLEILDSRREKHQ